MNQKIMIFGLGLVGNAVLDLLLDEKIFPTANILVADQGEEAFEHFHSLGGKPENRIIFHMDRENYLELLTRLEAGDYFMCLAEAVDHCVLMEACVRRRIHFIDSSDDCFDDEQNKYHLYEQVHLKRALEVRQKYGRTATSVLQFGCNPGLVSILAKKALKDIVYGDRGEYVSQNREALIGLLDNDEYATLAERLGVRRIVETDLDTTRTDIVEEPNTLYSTWNTKDFESEMNRRALFKLGTDDSLAGWLEKFRMTTDQVNYYCETDGTVILETMGKDVYLAGEGPKGIFEGCLIPHEELFSLYEYFSLRNSDGRIVYAPTVIFLYRPCPLALSSLFHKDNRQSERIVRERTVSGGEAVGIIVEGERFCSRYVYTELLITPDRLDNAGKNALPVHSVTPTVYQVAASLICAVKYIIRHPKEGVLYPENLNVDEVLSDVSTYLPVISRETKHIFCL